VLTDERILGSGDFVERVIREADERLDYQLQAGERRQRVNQLIQEVCNREKINIKELRAGSRRGRISQVRSQIAVQLVEKYGIPLAEVARQLGVSTSAISKTLTRVNGE
jgi:chromosomal replication initiation ATPase DnaA